jgi:PAS domain S-box-containing protein
MTLVRSGAAGASAAAAVASSQPPPVGDSMASMLDALPDAVLQTDLRGRIRYVNARAVRLTRRTRADMLGLRLVDLVREDYRERVMELLSAQLMDRQESTHAEFPLASNGDERWVALSTGLLEHPGRAASLLSTARDVTARRRAEQAGRRSGSRDPLTGLPDRDGFQIILEERIRLAKRTGTDVVLFSISLESDGAGDPRLCRSDYCQLQAARLLRATFRDSDVVARLDEGEFGVVAQSADANLSEVVRKRLRRLWEAQRKAGSWPEGVRLGFAALQRASHGRALGEIANGSDRSHVMDQPVWEILRRSARPLVPVASNRPAGRGRGG